MEVQVGRHTRRAPPTHASTQSPPAEHRALSLGGVCVCSAETIAILVVEFLVGFVAMQRTQYVWHGLFALALFPASLAVIAVLEANGFD